MGRSLWESWWPLVIHHHLQCSFCLSLTLSSISYRRTSLWSKGCNLGIIGHVCTIFFLPCHIVTQMADDCLVVIPISSSMHTHGMLFRKEPHREAICLWKQWFWCHIRTSELSYSKLAKKWFISTNQPSPPAHSHQILQKKSDLTNWSLNWTTSHVTTPLYLEEDFSKELAHTKTAHLQHSQPNLLIKVSHLYQPSIISYGFASDSPNRTRPPNSVLKTTWTTSMPWHLVLEEELLWLNIST